MMHLSIDIKTISIC